MAEGSAAARLRERLRGGPPLVGTFVKLPALECIDIAIAAGFDLVVVDAEHSQLDDDACRALVRHAAARGLATLVRMPSLDAGAANRLLEAGATGLQLSSLRTRGQRDALVAATRYAPGGTRSVSLAHPMAEYSAVPLGPYLERQAADPPVLVGQIETATNEEPLSEVLRGLDAAFIGTTDLSVDMGRPGKLDDERVRSRVKDIAAAAERASVALGAWVATVEALASLRDVRLRYVLIGSDLQYLRGGLVAIRAAAAQALA